MKQIFVTLFLVGIIHGGYSQHQKKSVRATRINRKPIIDGVLNEPFWLEADEAKDFFMFQPEDGSPERENKKTVVKVAYDDEAIYFGAVLYDNDPASVPKQFTSRDQFGNVDFFLVSINPNNDGLNDTEFFVLSTGVQADAKVSSGDEDFSWNTVWYSKVTYTDYGWVVEIKIPYAALRFSKTSNIWGVNFHRRVHNLNEQFTWNYIDRKKGIFTQYAGEITNIDAIEPPVRLNFSPYASTITNHYNGKTESDYNVGLDFKYGISEGFTLDATLIPDFGQVAFDDQILNLGPFEQRFAEQRPFFTEGTELFNKGDLFYSRRIGSQPTNYNSVYANLQANEEVITNPDKVNMLNAIKVSGRTKNALGIGFFNAITEKTEASIKNTATDEIRKEVTEPLANYNVLVVDQQFNKNSSITLVNTNVTRSGDFRDANVTGLLFDLRNKANKYRISGNYKLSNVFENGNTKSGYSTYAEFAKIFGNIQYEIGHWRSSATYDIGDLGFFTENNVKSYWSEISYRIFEPINNINNLRISFNSSLKYLNKPHNYIGNEVSANWFLATKNRFAVGGRVETSIGNQNDFNEPRVFGRYFTQPGTLLANSWISTDYRKKFAIDVSATIAKRFNHPQRYYELNISPRYRFSDKFEVIYGAYYGKMDNEVGFVTMADDQIIFGDRKLHSLTNIITSKLSFTIRSSIALSFRYYWSPVKYDTVFYDLQNDGSLAESAYTNNHDINFNLWNLDLNYSWEFAPGSQLVVFYRNSIFKQDSFSDINFSENLKNLFQEPINHTFSVKFIYFLDYNNLKNWFK